MTKETFRIKGREVTLSNLDKVYFPEINGTKAELVDYYLRMAPYILPYLKDRPFSMLHYPDGVEGESFFMSSAPRMPRSGSRACASPPRKRKSTGAW